MINLETLIHLKCVFLNCGGKLGRNKLELYLKNIHRSLDVGSMLTRMLEIQIKKVDFHKPNHLYRQNVSFLTHNATGCRLPRLPPSFPCVHLPMHVKTKASLERFGIFCTDLVLCIIFVTYSLNGL